MNLKGLAALAGAALLSAAAGFGAWHWLQVEHKADEASAGVVNAMEFQGLDGKPHRLSEWRGKVVLVNFWASWCVPCLNEIPLLVEAQKAHAAEGLQVVGLAMDTAEQVKLMQQRLAINYPLLMGQTNVMDAMDAFGDELGAFPYSVLIGRDGRVLGRIAGAMQADDLKAMLKGQLSA